MTPKIEIFQDQGLEIPPNTSYMDLRKRAQAACNTIELLKQHGAHFAPGEYDDEQDGEALAAELVTGYAKDFEKTSKRFTDQTLENLSVSAIQHVNLVISEFGQAAAASALEIRNLIKNRLILETDNPDPRIRLRAIELLGKMPEIGAFLERSEVNINHRSSKELVDTLKEKLLRLTKDSETGVYEVVQDDEQG